MGYNEDSCKSILNIELKENNIIYIFNYYIIFFIHGFIGSTLPYFFW